MSACDPHLEQHKKAFATKHAAERSIRTIRRVGARTSSGKKPVRAYVCTGCGRWFLTSKPE